MGADFCLGAMGGLPKTLRVRDLLLLCSAGWVFPLQQPRNCHVVDQTNLGSISTLSFIACVTIAKSLNFSELPFPFPYSGNNEKSS